jgi:hypothetical protein
MGPESEKFGGTLHLNVVVGVWLAVEDGGMARVRRELDGNSWSGTCWSCL